jgi:peptidoglycan/LPS O-acetylase OafA/YrhL
VEGLRGLAVIPVLLYHAAAPGWSGGYVGVDVFLVLSGYLITGLLVREFETTGGVSLAGFYARRSRRILPAAALVLVATVVASACFLPPIRVPDVAIDGIWVALFSANIHFALQATDYLQSELAPSPLLHYWSLGVEEQFYLFWPALLLVVAGRRSDFLRRIGLVVAAVVAGSLVLSLYLTAANLPWAFFSLPARAWELGIGALLAVAEMSGMALPAGAAAVVGWVGVGLIALAVASFGAETPFPGTAALVPTIGALLLIAAGAPPSRFAPGRLLSTRIPRFFGRNSYSLYLWSWPLLAIPSGMSDAPLPLAARLALLGLTIPLAALTQRGVEQPLRRGRFIGTVPRRNLALAAALSVAAIAVSLAAYGRGQMLLAAAGAGAETGAPPEALVPQMSGPLPADVRPSLAVVRTDAAKVYRDGCHMGALQTHPGACAYGDRAARRTVVIFGDSHAAQWFPALEPWATAHSWRLLSRTKSACGPADVPVWKYSLKREYTECAEWREVVLRELAAARPNLVILSGARTPAVVADGVVLKDEARERAWAAGLKRTIERLRAMGARVVVIGDTPRPDGDAPTCLSKHPAEVGQCATARARSVDDHWRELERTLARDTGAAFVDPTDWVCPSDPCPAVISSRLVFRDNHHLSTPLVELLAPRLAAALRQSGF